MNTYIDSYQISEDQNFAPVCFTFMVYKEKEYVYKLLWRPADIGNYPSENLIEKRDADNPFGEVVYSEPLTIDTIIEYDLSPDIKHLDNKQFVLTKINDNSIYTIKVKQNNAGIDYAEIQDNENEVQDNLSAVLLLQKLETGQYKLIENAEKTMIDTNLLTQYPVWYSLKKDVNGNYMQVIIEYKKIYITKHQGSWKQIAAIPQNFALLAPALNNIIQNISIASSKVWKDRLQTIESYIENIEQIYNKVIENQQANKAYSNFTEWLDTTTPITVTTGDIIQIDNTGNTVTVVDIEADGTIIIDNGTQQVTYGKNPVKAIKINQSSHIFSALATVINNNMETNLGSVGEETNQDSWKYTLSEVKQNGLLKNEALGYATRLIRSNKSEIEEQQRRLKAGVYKGTKSPVEKYESLEDWYIAHIDDLNKRIDELNDYKILIPELHKNHILTALAQNKYHQAIATGEMPPQRATEIITSAGLQVPEDIAKTVNPFEKIISFFIESNKEVEKTKLKYNAAQYKNFKKEDTEEYRLYEISKQLIGKKISFSQIQKITPIDKNLKYVDFQLQTGQEGEIIETYYSLASKRMEFIVSINQYFWACTDDYFYLKNTKETEVYWFLKDQLNLPQSITTSHIHSALATVLNHNTETNLGSVESESFIDKLTSIEKEKLHSEMTNAYIEAMKQFNQPVKYTDEGKVDFDFYKTEALDFAKQLKKAFPNTRFFIDNSKHGNIYIRIKYEKYSSQEIAQRKTSYGHTIFDTEEDFYTYKGEGNRVSYSMYERNRFDIIQNIFNDYAPMNWIIHTIPLRTKDKYYYQYKYSLISRELMDINTFDPELIDYHYYSNKYTEKQLEAIFRTRMMIAKKPTDLTTVNKNVLNKLQTDTTFIDFITQNPNYQDLKTKYPDIFPIDTNATTSPIFSALATVLNQNEGNTLGGIGKLWESSDYFDVKNIKFDTIEDLFVTKINKIEQKINNIGIELNKTYSINELQKIGYNVSFTEGVAKHKDKKYATIAFLLFKDGNEYYIYDKILKIEYTDIFEPLIRILKKQAEKLHFLYIIKNQYEIYRNSDKKEIVDTYFKQYPTDNTRKIAFFTEIAEKYPQLTVDNEGIPTDLQKNNELLYKSKNLLGTNLTQYFKYLKSNTNTVPEDIEKAITTSPIHSALATVLNHNVAQNGDGLGSIDYEIEKVNEKVWKLTFTEYAEELFNTNSIFGKKYIEDVIENNRIRYQSIKSKTIKVKLQNKELKYLNSEYDYEISKIYSKNKTDISIISNHKFYIQQAISEGKYHQAIATGEMTPQRATEIITSAGLQVPEDIAGKLTFEQFLSECKIKEIGTFGGLGIVFGKDIITTFNYAFWEKTKEGSIHTKDAVLNPKLIKIVYQYRKEPDYSKRDNLLKTLTKAEWDAVISLSIKDYADKIIEYYQSKVAMSEMIKTKQIVPQSITTSPIHSALATVLNHNTHKGKSLNIDMVDAAFEIGAEIIKSGIGTIDGNKITLFDQFTDTINNLVSISGITNFDTQPKFNYRYTAIAAHKAHTLSATEFEQWWQQTYQPNQQPTIFAIDILADAGVISNKMPKEVKNIENEIENLYKQKDQATTRREKINTDQQIENLQTKIENLRIQAAQAQGIHTSTIYNVLRQIDKNYVQNYLHPPKVSNTEFETFKSTYRHEKSGNFFVSNQGKMIIFVSENKEQNRKQGYRIVDKTNVIFSTPEQAMLTVFVEKQIDENPKHKIEIAIRNIIKNN